jgi:hypothetical protein
LNGLKAVSSGKLWHPAGKMVKNGAKKSWQLQHPLLELENPNFSQLFRKISLHFLIVGNRYKSFGF